jgi:site-specific DNA-methyltransferase (adenine-specific)
MTYPDDFINKVIQGDCLEVMKYIPDKSIDLVLTDPPYNAGREYDNDSLTDKEYQSFTVTYLAECKRVLTDNGNLVLIIGVKYQKPAVMWLFNNMNYCWEFCWWKSNGMLNGKATFSKFEKVVWFSKGTGTYCRQKPEYTDVWNIPIRTQENNNGHPTPKDIRGIYKIIKLLSNEADLILDPFLGSGTTAVACKRLNRRFIGIEISEKYCQIARDRLANEPEPLFKEAL